MKNLKDYTKELLINFWQDLPHFTYQESLYIAVQQDQTYLKNQLLLKMVNLFHCNSKLGTCCTFRPIFSLVSPSAIPLISSIRAHFECWHLNFAQGSEIRGIMLDETKLKIG